MKEDRQKRKQSLIAYLNDPKNEPQRLWQAIRNWAFEEYKSKYSSGEKPEIHKIFAGFDETAFEDTFYWE